PSGGGRSRWPRAGGSRRGGTSRAPGMITRRVSLLRARLRAAAGRRRLARHELVEQAALALEEALRVEGIGKAQVGVVEVMADLVQQRAQERAESDDALVGDRAHPDADARRTSVVARVEAVQLARAAQPRPHGQDADADGLDAEAD